MTTITTAHHRTPLVASLAASAALVVGGALGVAWEQNHQDTPTPATHTVPTTPDSFGGATTSQGFSGSVNGHLRDKTPFGGVSTGQSISGAVDGHLGSSTPFGGSTTGQESTQ